jgi:two-component system chemotaxis response regulator CheB
MEQKTSAKFAIIVIGGSAGALTALQRLVGDLKPDIPAAIFVATHVPPDSVSAMPHILSRCGAFFATHAIDGAPIAPGRIIVAPPNFHLVIERGVMRVVDWAKENGQRPSIDVLFRSAALAYGDLVCGVLLSGTLDDGVAGMHAIRDAGGMTIVQDPADALFADMPRNAILSGAAEASVATEDLAPAIARSVTILLENGSGGPSPGAAHDERSSGHPSVFTCPDCGGTLWESDEHGNLRYRCRTGHAYNVNAIMSAQHTALEGSLWVAQRIIEERIDFFRRMARRAGERGDPKTAERYDRQAKEHEADHARVRQALAEVVSQRHSTAS